MRLDVAAHAAEAPGIGTLRPSSAGRNTEPAPAQAASTSKTRHYADLRQFVCGGGNELAYAAAQQVAAAPGKSSGCTTRPQLVPSSVPDCAPVLS